VRIPFEEFTFWITFGGVVAAFYYALLHKEHRTRWFIWSSTYKHFTWRKIKS